MADYERNSNVTKIVIGKPRRFGLFQSIPKRLLTRTPNIDIYLLDAKVDPKLMPKKRITFTTPLNYVISILSVVVMSLIAFLLQNSLDQVNLFFMLLLPVVFSALYLGKGPSVTAALTSIVIFDYLFVTPRFSFTVGDAQYFFSFIVYIIVVVVISNLVSQLRGKVDLLKQSEVKNIALYGLSRDFVTAHTEEQVLSIMVRHTLEIFPCEMAVASWVLINKQSAGRGTSTLPQARAYYLPMLSGDETIGVAGFDFKGNEQSMTTEKRAVLKTIVRLGAMALERIKRQ
jgi:two-component system sensor histidine kinase KdpD